MTKFFTSKISNMVCWVKDKFVTTKNDMKEKNDENCYSSLAMKIDRHITLWNQEITKEWKSLKIWYDEVEYTY